MLRRKLKIEVEINSMVTVKLRVWVSGGTWLNFASLLRPPCTEPATTEGPHPSVWSSSQPPPSQPPSSQPPPSPESPSGRPPLGTGRGAGLFAAPVGCIVRARGTLGLVLYLHKIGLGVRLGCG